MDFKGEVDHYVWQVIVKEAPIGEEKVMTSPFTKKEVAKKALRLIEEELRKLYQETRIKRKSKGRIGVKVGDLDNLSDQGVSELVFRVKRVGVKSSIGSGETTITGIELS